jgi:hypothetical protein
MDALFLPLCTSDSIEYATDTFNYGAQDTEALETLIIPKEELIIITSETEKSKDISSEAVSILPLDTEIGVISIDTILLE